MEYTMDPALTLTDALTKGVRNSHVATRVRVRVRRAFRQAPPTTLPDIEAAEATACDSVDELAQFMLRACDDDMRRKRLQGHSSEAIAYVRVDWHTVISNVGDHRHFLSLPPL